MSPRIPLSRVCARQRYQILSLNLTPHGTVFLTRAAATRCENFEQLQVSWTRDLNQAAIASNYMLEYMNFCTYGLQHLMVEHDDLFRSKLSYACSIPNRDSDVSLSNASIYLNDYPTSPTGSRVSCGKLLYKDMVKMKDPSTGAVASFNTSFSFHIVGPDGNNTNYGDGLAFTFAKESNTTGESGGTMCLISDKQQQDGVPNSNGFFAVEFDTHQNTEYQDVSTNHIGVDINSMISVGDVYNLCAQSTCSTFYTGGNFTASIVYDSNMDKLSVWFGPPDTLIITVPSIGANLSKVFNEHMYVGFSGSSGARKEIHRIDSWSFNSSLAAQNITPSSPSSPAPNSPATNSPAPVRAHSSTHVNTPVILSVCGAGAAVFLFCAFLLCCIVKRRKSTRERNSGNPVINHLMGPRMFTYQELSKATRNFSASEILGSGGFGEVYKGTLQPLGTLAAVKRCNRPNSKRGAEGFIAEAASISQIRHRNLVQLQGWCHEKGQLLLVYDYMPNKSLDEWLFNDSQVGHEESSDNVSKPKVLTLEMRYNILAGVAAALAYLHEEWQQCVLHRDIKSSNVMLDANFNAHLGDFGLARLIDHQKMEKTTMMAGTLGYMAPEMHYTGKATKETDVYSFGVLVLEVVCGRKSLDVSQPHPEDLVLVECVWRAHEAGNLLQIVDPNLERFSSMTAIPATISETDTTLGQELSLLDSDAYGDMNYNLLLPSTSNLLRDLLRLGLSCCQPDPSARPSIGLVNRMFQSRDMTTLPPLPAAKPLMPYVTDFSRSSTSEGLISFSSSATSSSIISASTTSSQDHFISVSSK